MTSLTERYLAQALRGIPERQRADVEGELRSSIADAVEDRVRAGEEREAAERAVLEGLGNPVRLAAEYAGSPLYLIGPELFLVYRHMLPRLLAVVMPIVALVQVVVGVAGGEGYLDSLLSAAGVALQVGVHLCFWVTLTFAFLERADAARDARTEIVGATNRWTVDMMPEPSTDRVSVGETVGEVVTTLISIGGLLLLRDLAWLTHSAGNPVPILDPALSIFWLPLLIAVLASIAVLQVIVFLVGRWTLPLAIGYALLQLAFAIPVVLLALGGMLINPAFAERIGWPQLAEGDGFVMLIVAVATTLITAWDIFDASRRARRAHRPRPIADLPPTTT